jgi:uncharacterized membrane protein YdjX (TVP38/TMEM64 family)
MMNARHRGWIKPVVILAAVVVLLVLGAKTFALQERVSGVLSWIDAQGAVGLVVFLFVYILACVLLLPGSILTLGAGAIYGVAAGAILVSISSTLGATAAFLVGRYVARGWVSRRTAGNKTFVAIDRAVAREGWKIVGLTRLSPAFPFALLNYGYGLTRVSLRDYVLASWIGMLPGTVMYVYMGSLAGDLASLGTPANGDAAAVGWALKIVGFVATVGVTLYVTRIARRALSERINDEDAE